MEPFVPVARDRLEAPICRAIEAGDYKQALKLVEKRLAKSDDPYLIALKTFIQCNHFVVVERARGMATIVGKANDDKPQRYTIEELELYEEGLNVLFQNKKVPQSWTMCQMRMTAVKASPKDEKLALACLRGCLAKDLFLPAQTIAISMMNNFPQSCYQFYYIVITYILADSMGSEWPPEQVELYKRLAYSKLRSFAAATTQYTGPAESPTPRRIRTPQELLLFHRLLKDQKYDKAGVKLLQHEQLGPASKVAKGLWIFRLKEVQLLELQERWEELFELCRDLLSKARRHEHEELVDAQGAYWDIWRLFLKSAEALTLSGAARPRSRVEHYHLRLVYKELSAHLATNAGIEKPFQRNALLALIDFETSLERCYPSCESLVKSRLDLGLSGAVYILCVYGYKYGSTPIAFGDIGPVLEKFSEKDQREFLNAMPSFFDRTVGRQNLPEEMFEDRPRSVPKWIDDVFVQKSPMSKGEQLVCATSRMKIEYLIKSSMAENERRRFLRSSGYTKQRTACTWCDGSISNPSEAFCHACLRKLAEESLKAYGTAIENTKEMFGNTMKSTDIHPADDFVIIAAMCLVKLAGCIPCDTNTADVRPRGTLRELLQACAMLEFAHSHSTANKQTLLLLVRLYQILGAGSLAMRAFARLGVKQIQLETLGYAILDRSSSLHPHAASDISPSVVDNLSPQYHIGRMNKLYKKAGKDIQDNIWRAFKEESYDSIFQFCDVADNLSKSLTAAMTIIESRRIDRVLKGMPKALNRSSHGYDMLIPDFWSETMADNSDYAPFPNLEQTGCPTFEQHIRLGAKLSHVRAESFFLIEELWMLLCTKPGPYASRIHAYKHTLALFERVKDDLGEATLSQHFTISEQQLVLLVTYLLGMIACACKLIETDMGLADEDLLWQDWTLPAVSILYEIEGGLQQIANEVDDDQQPRIPAFDSTLHPIYTAYEACQLAQATGSFILEHNAGGERAASGFKEFQFALETLRATIMKTSRKVNSGLQKSGWLDFVKDEVEHESTADIGSSLGPLIASTVGESFLESWAAEMVESWRDSVNGFNNFK